MQHIVRFTDFKEANEFARSIAIAGAERVRTQKQSGAIIVSYVSAVKLGPHSKDETQYCIKCLNPISAYRIEQHPNTDICFNCLTNRPIPEVVTAPVYKKKNRVVKKNKKSRKTNSNTSELDHITLRQRLDKSQPSQVSKKRTPGQYTTICNRCSGDGGIAGGCYKCGGSGWM